MRGLALVALLAATACSFSPGAYTPDGAIIPDTPPAITVGFAKDTTLTDENGGTVPVRVILSKPAETPITVSFAVTGGTANRPGDYTLTDGTLAFAVGDVEETINIVVGADATEESDETIILALSNPTGAVLGVSMHTVTISANVLPRVTFEQPSSNGDEATSPTINAVLDVASALTTSVQVAVVAGGTATGGGVDYTLDTTTVMFNPGEMSKPVSLAVVNDMLDEDPEMVTLQLQNATNLIVGTAATTTHTITDNDDPPTVSFVGMDTNVTEGAGTAVLTVQLSTESGKQVSVPFSINQSSTATVTSDYTLATTTPLTIAAGSMQAQITFNIVQNMVSEPSETIIVDLAAATNATTVAPQTRTITIADDDATCLGAGNYQVCYPFPTQAHTLSGTIDTSTDGVGPCAATQPSSGWTGQPSSCFVVGTSITVSGITVTGSRPLVLFSTGGISITGDLDVSSKRGGTTGPGANSSACGNYTDNPANSNSGAGGGAGGTFRTLGGNGGQGNGANGSGGTAVPLGTAPTVLRGGCAGQKGGNGGPNTGGAGGAGGGAIYLVAAGQLSIGNGIAINASGAGGVGGASSEGGGGGGGSGGMIVINATSYALGGARLMANGGGGGGGADGGTNGGNGGNPATNAPNTGGAGGSTSSAGGDGGNGYGGSPPGTAATAGQNDSSEAGGGGGGGGGYIQSNASLNGANAVSAGEVVVAP